MSWYRVEFSPQDIAKTHELQNAFGNILTAASNAHDAALVAARPFTSNQLFFSPGAARIAEHLIGFYGGVKCPPPKRSEVAILVSCAGDEHIPFAPEE